MPSVNLDDAEYYGKVSTLPRNREAPRTCRICGSSLAGRYQGVRFVGGQAKRVWVCGCKHTRYVPVEAAAA